MTDECNQCPRKSSDFVMVFGHPVEVPVCELNRKEVLPFEAKEVDGKMITEATGVTPEWCQLRKGENSMSYGERSGK